MPLARLKALTKRSTGALDGRAPRDLIQRTLALADGEHAKDRCNCAY
jgi:hypothetical protein